MASALIFISFGSYLIFRGATADYLIDESEGLTDSEQKEKAKATPFTRFIVICAGVLHWVGAFITYCIDAGCPISRFLDMAIAQSATLHQR